MIFSARSLHSSAGSTGLASEAPGIDQYDAEAGLSEQPRDRAADETGSDNQHIRTGVHCYGLTC